LVRCHARVSLPAELATVLIPHRGAIRQEAEPRLASMAQAAVQVYELEHSDESQGFFFALGGEAWSFGPWSSDARMLYCRIEKEKLAHLVVIGGTRVAWQGQPLLQTEGPSDFFEWRGQDALMNAAPREFSITPLFEGLTGSSRSSSSGLNHDSTNRASKQDSLNRSLSTYAEKR